MSTAILCPHLRRCFGTPLFQSVRRENIPARPASDWSVMRIYPRRRKERYLRRCGAPSYCGGQLPAA
eukprot:1996044-Pyramimonas_sp.AAC.1